MPEIGKPFNNIDSYNDSMRKAMKDKLFFLDFVPERNCLFVDFGCADGSLITALYESKKYDDSIYIGYDISSEMINLAKGKFNHQTNNVSFTTNWGDVLEKLQDKQYKRKILILSSVIHEVYSYAKCESEIIGFWDKVLYSAFDYICVRDMMYSQDMNRSIKSSIFSLDKSQKKLQEEPLKSCLNQFEEYWGSINNVKNLIHFLLKYRWQINWERELNENYFPIEVTEFLDKFKEKYNTVYLERFRVPFLEECWSKDFGIKIDDYTHIKCIFEIKK